MKVRVIKRFNGNDPGAVLTCTRELYTKWKAYGYVEEIVEKKADPPKKKVIGLGDEVTK